MLRLPALFKMLGRSISQTYVRVLACLIALLAPCLNATTLVGIWNRKRITIAADSKQTITRGGQIVGSQTGCKIFQGRNLIFAFSGLAKDEAIDVVERVKSAKNFTEMGTNKPLPEIGPLLAAQQALEEILRSRHQPGVIPSAEMIIAGTVRGQLVMFHIKSELREPGKCCGLDFANWRSVHPDEKKTEKPPQYEFAGITNAITRFKANLTDWNLGTDAQVARRLIALEASDSSDSLFVGPPISIIEITKKGPRWVEKGECQWEPARW